MRRPGRFQWLVVLMCAASVVLVAGGTARAQDVPTVSDPTVSGSTVVERIAKFREETWRWQRLMRRPRTPYYGYPERWTSEVFRQWALEVWRGRALRMRAAAGSPPRLSAWLCIHRREGPWTANTGNGYYGGLQMDLTFQRMYGLYLLRSKGRAHRWTPTEQIWIAVRAYRSGRGFYPWPNAARACGLI